MASLLQGAMLPASVTTAESAQQAPEFYTNYLQDIANLGQSAVQQGGIAGFSPLQQQAFQMAPTAAFAGASSMGAGADLLGQAGATTVPDVIADYMNPYTRGVVGEMGRLAQRNITENVLPNIGAASIGTGQFGSRRQQQITANAMRDLQSDLIGKQLGALQAGYSEAGKFAQTDLERALNAGRAFGTLGGQQQDLATTGLKTLSELGGTQQALGQKMLDYPMAQAKAYGELLRGYQMPMAEVKQTTAPGQQTQFANSPLSQIVGLLTGLGSFLYGKDQGIIQQKKGGPVRRRRPVKMASGGAVPAPQGAAYHDNRGNYYDANGHLVG